jgi:hypothetical protein
MDQWMTFGSRWVVGWSGPRVRVQAFLACATRGQAARAARTIGGRQRACSVILEGKALQQLIYDELSCSGLDVVLQRLQDARPGRGRRAEVVDVAAQVKAGQAVVTELKWLGLPVKSTIGNRK